jgi:hypothetical protein
MIQVNSATDMAEITKMIMSRRPILKSPIVNGEIAKTSG